MYFYFNNGIHYLDKNISIINNNNFFLYIKKNIIQGNNLYYDHNRNYGFIKKNIFITNKEQNIYIIGDYLELNNKSLIFKIIGNIMLYKKMLNDNIFIISNKINYKLLKNNSFILNSYYNTKFFFNKKYIKSNFLIYKEKDNYITFYKRPEMYIGHNNMMSGEKIKLFFNKKHNILYAISLYNNGFIINKKNINNISTVITEKIYIIFNNKKISKLLLQGNTQISVKNKNEKYYKILCNGIKLYIKNDKMYKLLCTDIHFNNDINNMYIDEKNIFFNVKKDYKLIKINFFRLKTFIHKYLKINTINNININDIKKIFIIQIIYFFIKY